MYDTLDAYRMHDYISPSDVKLYLESPFDYKRIKLDKEITDKDRSSTAAMERGNYYDDYFCSNKGEFEKKYKVFTKTMPPDKIASIVEAVYNYVIDNLFNTNSLNYDPNLKPNEISLSYKPLYDVILGFTSSFEYQLNWKEETRVNKVIDLGDEYFKFLFSESEKIAIDMQMKTEIETRINALLEDEIFGPTMRRIRAGSSGDIEIKFQLELYEHDLKIKGKLDIVVINHKNKTITPFDLKTAKNPRLFKMNYYKYRYDIQGSMYTVLLKSHYKELYPGYTVVPFTFIVIFTEHVAPALLYRMSEADLFLAQVGGEFHRQGIVDGWLPVINEINHQISVGSKFMHRKSVYDNKFVPIYDLFKSAILPDFKD